MQHAFLCDHKSFEFHPTTLHLIFGRGQFALYVANICWSECQKKENGRINAGSFLRCGGMMHSKPVHWSEGRPSQSDRRGRSGGRKVGIT